LSYSMAAIAKSRATIEQAEAVEIIYPSDKSDKS
jgi:hypothetical protein